MGCGESVAGMDSKRERAQIDDMLGARKEVDAARIVLDTGRAEWGREWMERMRMKEEGEEKGKELWNKNHIQPPLASCCWLQLIGRVEQGSEGGGTVWEIARGSRCKLQPSKPAVLAWVRFISTVASFALWACGCTLRMESFSRLALTLCLDNLRSLG